MTRSRLVFAALLLVPFIFLFSRQPDLNPANDCLRRLTYAGVAQSTHVCDSLRYVYHMEHLDQFIWQPNHLRARAAYVVGASMLAAALYPVSTLIGKFLVAGRLSGEPATAFVQHFPSYFALVVINFMILALALAMAGRLVGEVGPLAWSLQLAIVTCDLVHGMFWSQHSNFLNLLVPVGCTFYFVQGCRVFEMRLGEVILLGIAAAAAILTYAYACLWLPAFVLGALYRMWWMKAAVDAGARRLAGRIALLAIAGTGPVLGLIAFNRYYLHFSTAAEFDAAEVRQFAWVLDAWQRQELAPAMLDRGRKLVSGLARWLSWPALIAACSVVGLAGLGGFRGVARLARDPIIVGVLVTIASMLLFNFLQGFYSPRLVMGILLALFIGVARAAQIGNQRTVGALVLIGFAVWQVAMAFLSLPLATS